MRILYLLTSLGIGGAEKQVISLAERMAARGHTVAIVSLKHVDEECQTRLPILRLNLAKTLKGLLRGLSFARSFVQTFRPDIIHSHTFPANLFARILTASFTGTTTAPILINTIHNTYEGGWHRMLLYRVTNPLVHAVTAVSSAAADRFIRFRAVPADKLTVLTNGIDTVHYKSDFDRRKRLRRALQPAQTFLWIAVGRLAPAKDYPNLLRAFATVRETHPEAQLWIVGEGDSAALTSLAGPNVHFLGLRHDIPDLLESADAYVLSSAWEGMPLALGEAMSMEKPFVATDVGGVRELAGESGYLVLAHDSPALATAMLQLMDRPKTDRRFMGRAARSRIEQHFSMNAKTREWELFYSNHLPTSRAPESKA